jgi:hypothetical protein
MTDAASATPSSAATSTAQSLPANRFDLEVRTLCTQLILSLFSTLYIAISYFSHHFLLPKHHHSWNSFNP